MVHVTAHLAVNFKMVRRVHEADPTVSARLHRDSWCQQTVLLVLPWPAVPALPYPPCLVQAKVRVAL